LSPEEYAAKKGIVLSTLKFWVRVLRKEVEARTKSAVPAFLPVSVLHTTEAPAVGASVMVEVDLANGRRVRMQVRANTDFKQVSELVDALESGL
jgi:predicted thioesterase